MAGRLGTMKCRCQSKELYDWGSCKKGYMGNPSSCDCEFNKPWKRDEYLDIKFFLHKYLIGKLELAFENEILNTTENSLDDQKVICKKVIVLFTWFRQ